MGTIWRATIVTAVAAFALLLSCAGFMHGWTLPKYQRQLLSVGAGAGLERLRIERSFDTTVDSFVSEHGVPDFLYVADAGSVQLIYLREDFVATFQRSTFNPVSSVSVQHGVPVDVKRRIFASSPQVLPAETLREDGPSPAPSMAASDEYRPSILASGTCFAVDPNGLLLTSQHVVDGADTVVVGFPGRQGVVAEIIKEDFRNDLALLRISDPTPDYLALGRAADSRVGDVVFTAGFPAPELLGMEPKFTEGVLSAKSGLGDLPTLLQLTVPIQPGNSGGPVLNSRGEVIAIATSSAREEVFLRETGFLPQNVNWAVKAEYAAPLFPAPAAVPRFQSRSEAIDAALRSVCLVIAFE
jgi:S1-C subfamily serine protease